MSEQDVNAEVETETEAAEEGLTAVFEKSEDAMFGMLQGLMRDVSSGRKTVRTTDEGWLLFENAKDDDV